MRIIYSEYTKYILLLCWTILIILFSVLDYGHMPVFVKDAIQFKQGYIIHFCSYFFASFLIWISFNGSLPKRISVNGLLFCLSVGLEVSQLYVPSRAFNPMDITMNFSGIIGFNLLPASIHGWKKVRRSSR